MFQNIDNQKVLWRLRNLNPSEVEKRKKEIEQDFEDNSSRHYIAGYVYSDGSEVDEPENYEEVECDCCGKKVMWTRVYEVEHESGLDSDIQYLNMCKECALDLWESMR